MSVIRQQAPRKPGPRRSRSSQRLILPTIALCITAGLVFTALLGGFLTGVWEPFRFLCPFGLGVLAGQLPNVNPS
jgi:hypothetical protein